MCLPNKREIPNLILRGDTNLFGAVPGRAPSVDLKKKKKVSFINYTVQDDIPGHLLTSLNFPD